MVVEQVDKAVVLKQMELMEQLTLVVVEVAVVVEQILEEMVVQELLY